MYISVPRAPAIERIYGLRASDVGDGVVVRAGGVSREIPLDRSLSSPAAARIIDREIRSLLAGGASA